MTTNRHLKSTASSINENSIRADSYRILAALLYDPPSVQLLAELRRIDVGTLPEETGAAWEMLKKACMQFVPLRIKEEYHQLFIGIGRGEIVPYASWYLEGLLMAKPLAFLRKDLADFGVTRLSGVFEPEDHAAALFEAMALICQSGEITMMDQALFFTNHIGSWMIQFFQDLQTAKSAEFYRIVGYLGERFLAGEQRYLDETLNLG